RRGAGLPHVGGVPVDDGNGCARGNGARKQREREGRNPPVPKVVAATGHHVGYTHHRYPAFSLPHDTRRAAVGASRNVWPSHWCAYPCGIFKALPVVPENVQPVRWFSGKFPSCEPPVTL